jgi:hypothetical protein
MTSISRIRAQSAMEYLMTYGWAILIIAVVLGALFSLGIFGSGGLVSTACVAGPGFLCSSPVMDINGNVFFTFGQSLGSSIYNVGFGCAATSSTAGLPGNTLALEYVYANGIVSQYPANGPITAVATPLLVGNSMTLSSGGTTPISALKCYTSTGQPEGGSTGAQIGVGVPFSGSLWINYTNGAGAPTVGAGNPMLTSKFATIAVKSS